MTELHGGPADGTNVEVGPDADYQLYETQHTCSNHEHSEVRVHTYGEDGEYKGVTRWMLRAKARQRK